MYRKCQMSGERQMSVKWRWKQSNSILPQGKSPMGKVPGQRVIIINTTKGTFIEQDIVMALRMLQGKKHSVERMRITNL